MFAPTGRCPTAPLWHHRHVARRQARGNGAVIRPGSAVTAEKSTPLPPAERPAQSWSRPARAIAAMDFRGRPPSRLPGSESGRCVTWDEVALDKVKISGEVLVIDEMADVAAPLTAVKLAKLGGQGQAADQVADDRH